MSHPGEPFIKRLTDEVRRDTELKNEARKACKLSLITVIIRTCLACGVKFESIGNRTCGCTRRKP